VADNNGNVSTLYNGAGQKFPLPPAVTLVVSIPAPDADIGGTPTGVVFNEVGTGFIVTDKQTKKSGSSLFIFATEDGTIAGWSPALKRTQAFIAVDNSKVPDATNGGVYKGLAIAMTGSGQRLYATNFRFGTVDVFDSNFELVTSFTDPTIRGGFAPFGIHNIGGDLYVTFAKQGPGKADDDARPGNGFVDLHRVLCDFVFVIDVQRNESGIAGNDHQQVIEIVGNSAGKLPNRFHFLCLTKLSF